MSNITPRLRSVFAEAFDKIRKGELKTLIPFLSLFRINGKPLNLNLHYQFAPVFNCVQPVHTCIMTARQVGKSWAIAEDAHIRSSLIPGYHNMIIQPRADQIQRFNATVFQPLMRSSLIQSSLITNMELSKLALKTYNNGSLVYLDSMYLNADRIRGASGLSSTTYDEAQDLEMDNIRIANETMSASLFWGFSRYTGTPKTTDTTLALLWNKSSQAEWVIRCTHCGYFNVPSIEHDLVKMIGKEGPICAKCGKHISPADGGYVHAFPDRALSFAGYHISQTIHPLHTSSINKWMRLLDKVNNYEPLILHNEVLGVPYDAATSPLTMSDMQKATHDIPELKRPRDIERIADQYSYITVGVDWGGGGAISDSYTSYAVLGMRASSDVIDVLYGRRIPKGVSPMDEVHEILDWIQGTGADAFAFDNGGAGFARLEMMKQAGLMSIPNLTVVPMNYVAPHSGDVMKLNTAQREPDMYYYTLDKSRSLAICLTAIKSVRLRFPKFSEEDEKAYQRDFLALREDPSKSVRNETVILIVKKPGVPDDFAHAVNFGCSQIWDHFGAYPRIGSRYDTSILDFDENNNRIMKDEDFGPRGDFERFRDAVESRAAIIEGDDPYDYFG